MATCASCGTENREGAKFCDSCGAALASAPEHEQRKTVTILFCDVTGSTSLGESVDPEALRGLLARYFERMKAIVESHGGTVEKFIGDAVMAVFGVPVLHEDDALRAVRAAAEMRDALPQLGVRARIGVHTGEVVTGTAERLATGDAVNVAARLEQAAAPASPTARESPTGPSSRWSSSWTRCPPIAPQPTCSPPCSARRRPRRRRRRLPGRSASCSRSRRRSGRSCVCSTTCTGVRKH